MKKHASLIIPVLILFLLFAKLIGESVPKGEKCTELTQEQLTETINSSTYVVSEELRQEIKNNKYYLFTCPRYIIPDSIELLDKETLSVDSLKKPLPSNAEFIAWIKGL